MTVGLRFAWRNLWRHSRRTWLTAGAMVFSNVLLIFLISWQFASYELMINNSLHQLHGHFQIQDERYLNKPRIDYSFSLGNLEFEQIAKQKGVTALSRRAEAFVLASSEQRTYGIQIIGVEQLLEPRVSNLPGLVNEGRYLQSGEAEVVIGRALARNLKLSLGEELTIFGSAHDGSTAAAILKLVGIYESGSNDLDRVFGFIPLDQFDEIFSMRGQIHRLVVLTEEADKSQVIAAQLPSLKDGVVLRDWNELLPELKQAIQSDMASSWFMYIVLIVLVAFSVLNTQLMSVLERTKEYGVMMALGVSAGRLSYYVLIETALLAALGLIIGLLLGLVLVSYLGVVGLTFPGMEEMAKKFNIPATVYPTVSFASALFGPGLVFIASLLAALYPALRLRGLHIVQAMRAP